MLLNEKEWQDTFKAYFHGEAEFNIPMKNHTSLKIGGPADAFVVPAEPVSMRNMLVVFKEQGIHFSALGGGTNILVRDAGIEGVVISLKAFNRIEVLKEDSDCAELFVESGVPLQRLVNFCRERGYSGIEGLTGIPGTVGGAICGNAGSFGCEMKDVVVSVAIMDRDARLDRFEAGGLGFGYRRSGIRQTDIVLSANLTLKREDREDVSTRTEAFFSEKKLKQPISEKSAGCVFKNPGTSSAGSLIDEAGCKGMRIGDIEVSSVHANFFVNRGRGSASDFMGLMTEVSSIVQRKFGVVLEPEIKVVGRN